MIVTTSHESLRLVPGCSNGCVAEVGVCTSGDLLDPRPIYLLFVARRRLSASIRCKI